MQPTVQIDVDETSGVWRTDGLPMVYVPRHFMVNMHKETERTLGRAAYAEMLNRSGAKSARYWCQQQADLLGRPAPEIFAHYLRRLSERGWGRFTIEALDPEHLTARITLRDSIYVLEAEGQATAPTCYMFEGFLIGAMQFMCDARSVQPLSITCRESACTAMGAPECRFEVNCTFAA
ncbi:4-vinyl reductase [Paracoccus onubensis]|nr:4-vinyl reductase [Paracoccus onubensis]